ncbi:hypothetical protein PBY51_025034 [Eleginops maclovinus]|uniref:Leukemia NUP98 fusion partner 1 n=1 Tax=Eleginops maclovinus TaxID=56733 RepID=A0AAN7XXS4_ELEMC|nr:hypothetical protein PBY51_025034 [Eleginops maclovinus]
MSLRLLPGFMDNDDDDDGNFTKWMSSYWGHGAEAGKTRDRRSSFKRIKTPGDRRASLPTVSQLDAMHRIHAAAISSSSGHGKSREEKGEVRGEIKGEVRQHQRARRASSDDNTRSKTPVPENRISTIPELTEYFERRLQLRDTRSEAPDDEDRLCPLCQEEMLRSGEKSLVCKHRCPKEGSYRGEQCRPHSGSEATACQVTRPSEERRRSEDGQISSQREPHTFCRKLSLRRHR